MLHRAILTFTASAFAMLACVSTASANPSCYVGGAVSSQITSATTSGVTFSERGAGLGILAGCTLLERDKLTFGARLMYEISHDAKVDGAWQAAGILGYKINPNVEPYAVLGLAGARIKFDDEVKSMHTGYVAGLGVKIGLTDRIAVNVEAGRTFLNAKELATDVNVRPTSDVVRIGVTYKLF